MHSNMQAFVYLFLSFISECLVINIHMHTYFTLLPIFEQFNKISSNGFGEVYFRAIGLWE